MKKKNLTLLKLNKQSISNLKNRSLTGGTSGTVGCQDIPPFSEGDCFDTIGDDHCWTPFKWIGL